MQLPDGVSESWLWSSLAASKKKHFLQLLRIPWPWILTNIFAHPWRSMHWKPRHFPFPATTSTGLAKLAIHLLGVTLLLPRRYHRQTTDVNNNVQASRNSRGRWRTLNPISDMGVKLSSIKPPGSLAWRYLGKSISKIGIRRWLSLRTLSLFCSCLIQNQSIPILSSQVVSIWRWASVLLPQE